MTLVLACLVTAVYAVLFVAARRERTRARDLARRGPPTTNVGFAPSAADRSRG